MRSLGKVAAYAASALVVAGLSALAVPAVASIGTAARDVGSNLAETLQSPEPVPEPESAISAEADIEAARAEDPHPTDINHPSRWAPGCEQNSDFMYGKLRGAQTLVDMGAREYANGAVSRDEQGRIAAYTVAPGDAPAAIGERFCVDYVTVMTHNGVYPTLQPGDVLSLLPR